MATSKCLSCNNHYFELQTIEPSGGKYKLNAVQCSSCGAVVGVIEYYDSGVLLKKQEPILEEQSASLNNLKHGQDIINRNLVTITELLNELLLNSRVPK